MDWDDSLTFASDAELAIIAGAAFLLLAAIALLAERRRIHRKHIDRVGCMPWLAVFLACGLVGGTLAVMGLIGVIRG